MAKPVASRGTARGRVIESALALFAEHGYNGTSLQMIADRLGVSKAAVYYQFHSKDDIALAVVRPVFDDIARVATIAEALPSPQARREAAVSGLVELTIRHRPTIAIFYADPAIHLMMNTHAEFEDATNRIRELLNGADLDTTGRVIVAMAVSGIYGAAMDPELKDIDDAVLYRTLLNCSQQLLRTVAPTP